VESGPFAEVRRVAAKIDGNVPDMAGDDADQFPLRPAKLVMKAAENTLRGKGLIILDELDRKTSIGKVLLIEDFREPAAIVAKAPGLHQLDVEQRGIDDLHLSSLAGYLAKSNAVREVSGMKRTKNESHAEFYTLGALSE